MQAFRPMNVKKPKLHKNVGFSSHERQKSMKYAIKQSKVTSPIWIGATEPSIN